MRCMSIPGQHPQPDALIVATFLMADCSQHACKVIGDVHNAYLEGNDNRAGTTRPQFCDGKSLKALRPSIQMNERAQVQPM